MYRKTKYFQKQAMAVMSICSSSERRLLTKDAFRTNIYSLKLKKDILGLYRMRLFLLIKYIRGDLFSITTYIPAVISSCPSISK